MIPKTINEIQRKIKRVYVIKKQRDVEF